jgi:hypothetical protein
MWIIFLQTCVVLVVNSLRQALNVYELPSRTTCPLNMGPTGCPETSVTDYQSMLSNIPEQRRSLLKFHPRYYIKYSLYSWTAGPLNMGPTGCPETSVTDYQSMLSNIPEQRRSLLKFHSKYYITYSLYFFNSFYTPFS